LKTCKSSFPGEVLFNVAPGLALDEQFLPRKNPLHIRTRPPYWC
jgi:hypothetical protein